MTGGGVIREADERLSLEAVNQPYGSRLSVLQIGWTENMKSLHRAEGLHQQ